MEWDLFICHASEDKEHFVDPLARRLKQEGYKVWYDKFALKPGDSLRRSIDKGISESKYGLVVLSHKFFQKEWPQKELDSLISLETGDDRKIIPVWLDVNSEDIKKHSPLLADKCAITAEYGIDGVIQEIKKVIKPERFVTDAVLDKEIEKYLNANGFEQKYIIGKCLARFHQIVCFHNEESKIEAPQHLDAYEAEEFYSKTSKALIEKYEIPQHLYITFEVYVNVKYCNLLVSLIKKWVKGVLGGEKTYELYHLLDEYFDLDYLYILYGIPNHTVAGDQHKKLRSALLDIGSRNSDEKSANEEQYYKKILDKYY
jgi:hypothetical protein